MNTVELYIFDTREFTVPQLVDLFKLEKDEIKPFEKFAFEETKKEKIVSYYLKKHYAPDYYIDDSGKPQSFNLYFNVSHSKGMVVFALNKKHQIGVDIELVRPVEEGLKRYIANDEEFAYINSEEKFYEIWTSKESLSKCIGTGIKGKPSNIKALPIDGVKIIDDKPYRSKSVKIDNYVISITLNDDEDYQISIQKAL